MDQNSPSQKGLKGAITNTLFGKKKNKSASTLPASVAATKPTLPN